MIHFIVKNILLSLKLVETFANNSIYFLNDDIFLNGDVLEFVKCYI